MKKYILRKKKKKMFRKKWNQWIICRQVNEENTISTDEEARKVSWDV